jgi:hypothetical protein
MNRLLLDYERWNRPLDSSSPPQRAYCVRRGGDVLFPPHVESQGYHQAREKVGGPAMVARSNTGSIESRMK